MHGFPDRTVFLSSHPQLRRIQFPNVRTARRQVWYTAWFASAFTAMHNWPASRSAEANPRDQTAALLQDYIEGERLLVPDWDYKRLRTTPEPNPPEPVYALRTQDVRIFGAMLARGEFCACYIMPKSELREAAKYQPIIEHTREFIRNLGIPHPRFHKSQIDDVTEY